jgi:hypothetical protein
VGPAPQRASRRVNRGSAAGVDDREAASPAAGEVERGVPAREDDGAATVGEPIGRRAIGAGGTERSGIGRVPLRPAAVR